MVGMECETVFVLHRSQLTREVEVVVHDGIWGGGVIYCVEGVV